MRWKALGKCDHDWVISFLMAAELKMQPMDLIIGRLLEECVTNGHNFEQVSHIDNSDPWVAYPMEPTQNVTNPLHFPYSCTVLHFVTF